MQRKTEKTQYIVSTIPTITVYGILATFYSRNASHYRLARANFWL